MKPAARPLVLSLAAGTLLVLAAGLLWLQSLWDRTSSPSPPAIASAPPGPQPPDVLSSTPGVERTPVLGEAPERTPPPEMRWEGGCTVFGRVIEGSGEPARGAEVTLSGGTTHHATTGEGGSFLLTSVPVGLAFDLQVEHPHGATTRTDVHSALGLVDLGTLRLEETGEVRGTVRDAHGAPVADVTITLDGPVPARSSLDGTFLLPRVPVGFHTLTAEKPGHTRLAPESVDVHAGMQVLAVELTEGWTLHGTVRDSAGAPLADTAVTLDVGNTSFLKTDASGSYAFALPADTPCEICFRHPGLEKQELFLDRIPAGPLDVTLTSKYALEVLLTDSTTGEIVPDVTVLSTSSGGALLSALGAPSWPRPLAVTPLPSGGLRLALDDFHARTLFFLAEGYPALEVPLDYASQDQMPERLLLSFTGGVKVAVEVVDPGGTPLPGVDLRLVLAGDSRKSAGWISRANRSSSGRTPEQEEAAGFAFTDPYGKAGFRHVQPGEYALSLRHPGFAAQKVDVAVTASDPPVTRVVLDPGGTIEGTVHDPSGAPRGGVRLVAASRVGDLSFAYSAADGSYRFSRLVPGAYQVDPCERGQWSRYRVGTEWMGTDGRDFSVTRTKNLNPESDAREEARAFSLQVQSGSVTPHDVLLPEAARASVRGTVLLLGDPACGVEVGSFASRDSGFRDRTGRTATDASGTFLLAAQPAGLTSLSFVLGDAVWYEEDVTLSPEEETVVTVQLPVGTLQGTVVDAATAQALSGVQVRAWSSRSHTVRWRSARTDAQGLYQIGPLPLGDYRLTTHLPGYQTQETPLEIPSDGARIQRDLALSPGGWISITWSGTGPAPDQLEYTVLGAGREGSGLLTLHPPGRYWLEAGEDPFPGLQLRAPSQTFTFDLTDQPWPPQLQLGPP